MPPVSAGGTAGPPLFTTTKSRATRDPLNGTPNAIVAVIPQLAASVTVMKDSNMPVMHPKPPPRGDDLPCDDGEPMETMRHREQASVLLEGLYTALARRNDVFFAANMGVYFSETQALRNDFRAPDVFVVLDTTRKERKRWVVWEEDGRTPDVVIELTSESTEEVDRGQKMHVYARMLHVPIYVIYDPFSERLDAYRLDPAHRRYELIQRDERGLVRCEPLDLWLGVVPGVYHDIEAPWLRWVDNKGVPVPLEGERADAEAVRADAEAARARALEEEVARLRDEVKRR